jgi:hypothetical protein
VIYLIGLIETKTPSLYKIQEAIRVPHDVMFYSNTGDYANKLYKCFLILLVNVGKDIVDWPHLTPSHILKREKEIKREIDDCLTEYNILADLGVFKLLPKKIVTDIKAMADSVEDIYDTYYEYYRARIKLYRNHTIRNTYKKIRSARTRRNRTPLPTIPEENDNSY